jgi:hypothetical protein
MSKKPDLSELFQMLSEEKVKRSVEQDKKSKKSKKIQKDFMEEFSAEIKKLKEQEEQHKRDVAAMEAWLTSPVEEKNEEVEEIIEEHIVDIPEVPIEIADEPVPIEEEIVAETPLQEQALKYLNTKRQELTEEQQSVKILEKQIEDVKKSITSIRLGLQGQGGGGISKLSQADDIDRATALVNDKFLKYNATTGKFVGADASGGAVDLSAVDQNIVPATTETYDLGTSSKRWNDLFLAGETIDLGGTKISKDSSGDVSFKDSSNNLKKVIVEELHIGTGSNKLKLTRDSNGKLKALDNSNAKASHNVTFSELTGTPTTISGYGITDAFDGAYGSLTGTPTIPTVSNDFTNDDHSKLDGIEASADVTDTANVTAAGALMDSEVTNLAQVKAFDSSDYATAAQGAKADSAIQSGDLSPYATLSNPTLTGTPAAPTASTGTNTTQIATTAFVQQEITALKALLYAYDQS